MPSIRLLPEHLRNVIAAGEVIERPASVVKELIENSIDAGASKIKIEVLYGGKKLIKVTDDGTGMDRDDALLSVQRYATSKIATMEDLFKLQTLGFRGEALASIAAVSRLTIETGTDQTGPATLIEVAGGEVKSIRDAPPLRGTIVTVRDLFFNTPARRKFLRANSTELNHIIEIVTAEALSDFSRDYKLYADDTEVLFFPPVYEPRERIAQVFGMETREHMLEFENSFEDMRFQAFISKPPELRAKRTGQYIFVNQRPVRDYLISKAIYDGLGSLISTDRHPLFVAYLIIPPSKVDFNVHPTKKEVRFSDGAAIYDFIRGTVEEIINKKIEEHIGFKEQRGLAGEDFKTEGLRLKAYPFTHSPIHQFTCSPSYDFSSEFTGLRLFERDSTYEGAQPFICFGDIFIAMPWPDGLLIMDKHAAHERVLYEKFLNGSVAVKRLLFPKQVKLQPVLYRIILNNRGILKEMGFEIDDFGSGTVIVRTLPEFYREDSLSGILEEIGSSLKDSLEGMAHKEELLEKKKALAARLACHKSLRGGDPVNRQEIEALYRELLKTSDPYHCPHGRPTIVRLTIDELYKRFGRV